MTYNKTKNWNIPHSFPGNSFNELQVMVWFKIPLCIMYLDIHKRLLKAVQINKTKFDLKLSRNIFTKLFILSWNAVDEV